MAGEVTYSAAVLPANATNKTVTWSVEDLTGSATINSSTGVLTPVSLGTVKVIATANDTSGTTGEKTITIVAPTVLVTSITIEGPDTVSLPE